MSDKKIKTPRKGKARIILGCILVFFQLAGVLGDTSVLITTFPQTLEGFLFNVIYYVAFFWVSIVGLILLIFGVIAYNKSGKPESVNKEHTVKNVKPIVEEKPKTDSFNVVKSKKTKNNRYIVLKIILASVLILISGFGVFIGCAWFFYFLFDVDFIYILASLAWTVPSAPVMFLCIRFLLKLRPQMKAVGAIKQKEKCYKRIDKIHRYYERGSITKEEFESLKKDILSEMEE